MSAWKAAIIGSGRSPSRFLEQARRWRPLRIFFTYRLLLAALLAAAYFSAHGPGVLGAHDPQRFAWVSLAYLALVILGAGLAYLRVADVSGQAYVQAFLDIAALTVLMHASGGVQSGLGMLLVPAIAGASLLVAGRVALLFAAAAAMAILGEQVYAQIQHCFVTTAYTHAGTLGAAFFATALMAHVLASRVLESEQLAQRRAADVASLAELNAHIIQRMQSGVVVVDNADRVRLINRAARLLLGLPEPKTEALAERSPSLQELSPDLDRRLVGWRRFRTGASMDFSTRAAASDLIVRFTRIAHEASSATLIFLDYSAAVNRQAQQIKLASLGRLAASIAHEVRNPLGAISHAAQLLGEAPSLPSEDRRLLEIIRHQTTRMNSVIESVLQLSRRTAVRAEHFALLPWVLGFIAEWADAHKLERALVHAAVKPKDVRIWADPSHLRQVVSNLCDNAYRHGHVVRGKPLVELRGGIMQADGGPYLDVIDFGPGIDDDSAQHMFEPFYSSRADGTGLGLYIARELCQTNHAHLEYHPHPEGGSCFRIRFARSDEQELSA